MINYPRYLSVCIELSSVVATDDLATIAQEARFQHSRAREHGNNAKTKKRHAVRSGESEGYRVDNPRTVHCQMSVSLIPLPPVWRHFGGFRSFNASQNKFFIVFHRIVV